MISTALRRAPLVLLASTLIIIMVGCGSEHAGGSQPQPPKTEATDTPTDPQPQGTPSVVLRRSGGLAGFMDILTVKPDGRAVLTSHGRHEYSCSVKSSVLDSIRSGAARLRTPGSEHKRPKPTKTFTTPMNDQLYLTIEVGDTTVRYTDVPKDDQELRRLFTSMHDVLASAAAARDGKSSGNDVVCS